MHASDIGEVVTTDSVVKKWVDSVWKVGSDLVPAGQSPCPDTHLALDSFYHSSNARSYLLEKGQNFTCSCRGGRVEVEKRRAHSGGAAPEPGDTKTTYSPETKELFTYHWDTQKGVGEKYNLSFGLEVSNLKRKVKATESDLPGYSY